MLVGAMIVAGVATVWGGREQPGGGEIREQVWNADEAPLLEAGQELGRFFLGSTVVLVTEAWVCSGLMRRAMPLRCALRWHIRRHCKVGHPL